MEAVPGCAGTGKIRKDYCYSPGTSYTPSSEPSMMPSQQPSSEASSNPSSEPSEERSSVPSLSPSGEPSSKPSMKASEMPSSNPSSEPSSNPSNGPLSLPSMMPSQSASPTGTGLPLVYRGENVESYYECDGDCDDSRDCDVSCILNTLYEVARFVLDTDSVSLPSTFLLQYYD
jgi:hypothetical protein